MENLQLHDTKMKNIIHLPLSLITSSIGRKLASQLALQPFDIWKDKGD